MTPAEAQALYLECGNTEAVGKRLGMSKDAAWKLLKGLRVRMKSRGGAHNGKCRTATIYQCAEMGRACVIRDLGCAACRHQHSVEAVVGGVAAGDASALGWRW